MSVVPFEKEVHLPAIAAWWEKAYPGASLPAACIPPTGAVAMHRGKPGASCFVYTTNAAFAVLALAVADPAIPPSRRIDVLREAVLGAIELAVKLVGPVGVVWSCTDNAVVARVYEECGLTNPGGTSADVFYLTLGGVPSGFLE
jgi:hypothetical protein